MGFYNDNDPVETSEWLLALDSVIREEGADRAAFLLDRLLAEARAQALPISNPSQTPYINTIAPDKEQTLSADDESVARKLRAVLRWNAMAMVVRAGKYSAELGGHIATYASAATLYEVGFNYFFKADNGDQLGDLLYIQGHASPGIYARAFLEGRLTEDQLDHFRQEAEGDGLPSYPHPYLMPSFWQFPTVSMGLGPLQAIYQARFLKYLEARGLLAAMPNRKVWAFLGDGEMDEPESLGAINIAAREKVDNLIFVINCNLQRLDGPVFGNGKIIQLLEGIFNGAGWNVIKVIWGRRWDPLLSGDTDGLLKQRMEEAVDGDFQNYAAKDGAYAREFFFGKYPELKERVAHLSDDELHQLNRGGHDAFKLYAAYHRASTLNNGKPTVILAKTIKGFGMGAAGEALNITHQQKKLNLDQIKYYRDRFALPISDTEIEKIPYYKPDENSPEMQYLKKRREALGGYLPSRREKSTETLRIPDLTDFHTLLESSGDREFSTTMAFVRLIQLLLKDPNLKERVVPIIPDESRTFGMEGLFRQIGIYSAHGQLYEPVDAGQLAYYREDKKGQVLQEGINEAGAFSTWMAAATSYSTNNLAMIPFYIFYSMFGFQRIGDSAWAAGDMRARGFLLGATAGRTTLAGEGLQHQDGNSMLLASTIPNCRAYDPCFSYELAVLIHYGLERMFKEQCDEYFYLTLMNENYHHPAMPENTQEGIIKGAYILEKPAKGKKHHVYLLGGGTILREVIQAKALLEKDYDVGCTVLSVTSFTELGREGAHCLRYNRLHPDSAAKIPYITQLISETDSPVIAATDYVRAYADQIRECISNDYTVLGTDGFGLSDTREHLRHHFEVDANSIAYTSLYSLVKAGKLDKKILNTAQKALSINPNKKNPDSSESHS